MEEKERNDAQDVKCDPCQQNFEREINKLVCEADGYTEEDHIRKEEELEEAFSSDGEETTQNTTGNTTGSMTGA